MKTKIIQTGKATILVVDLPKGATNLVVKDAIKLGENHSIYPSIHYSFEGDKVVMLPEGNWKLLGFADKLTEIQSREMMAHCHFAYTDFMMPEPQAFNGGNICLKSAKDSFNSLLKANGIVTVNPYGEEHPHNYGLLHLYPTGDEIMDLSFQDALKWQQAQQELWANPVILLKQD